MTAAVVTLMPVGRRRGVSVKNMKKQFKISLAATAVAVTIISTGLTSYAMAQDRARAIGTSHGVSGQAANPVTNGETNSVLNLLSFAISENQNSLILRTNDEKVKAQVIQACNRAAFAMKSPSDQDAYRKVIDVERWATDKSVWREIAQTKSMVNALLHPTKDQSRLALNLNTAIWDKISKPTAEVIRQSPLLGMTQQEKLREQSNPPASRAVQMHRKWLDLQLADAMRQVRATLTKDQGAEWDGILSLYNRHLPKINP